MTSIFQEAVKAAQLRYQDEIERASKAKKADKARIERRKNEQYHERLTRACLGVSYSVELTKSSFALVAAIPEVLLSKMYWLAWGDSRKQKNIKGSTSPSLLKSYSDTFGHDYSLSDAIEIITDIKEGTITNSLICHGLSPTSDTLLLLADLGRSIRIHNALGVDNIEILLADISWIKHNRSISQLFDKNEFIDQLRVCLDKRVRLYKALGLNHKIFGISDFDNSGNSIGKTGLTQAATEYRALATSLWGSNVLEKHNSTLKALIGKSFNGLSKNHKSMLPEHMRTLVSFDKFCQSLESSMTDELTILRTLSELFSTFDEDIFIYYFAQYFAQRKYNNYIKIAPYSEIKFDTPFEKNEKHFNAFIQSEKDTGKQINYNLYMPQYVLGKYQLLPYTSTSGDVMKKSIDVEEFIHGTILLNDSYHHQTDKVLGVLMETPIPHRNRLMSDLFSFIHTIIQNPRIDTVLLKTIKENLLEIDQQIVDQIFSHENLSAYKDIFSDAVKAIAGQDFVIPYHIIPYTWDEEDWTQEKIKSCSNAIVTLLTLVNEICE